MNKTSQDATSVSVIGLGAIGSRVVEVLLDAGYRVNVWNRTPGRADRLAGAGALPGESVAGVVGASPLALLCLTDYAAVSEVLDTAAPMVAGRTVVALTTGSPEEARRAVERAGRLGADYLDGGVQAAPESIGTDAATFLYSGSRSVFERHRAVLETVGTAHYLGNDPGAAAVQDLALFGLWYDAQIGYLRALETVRAAGIDPESFAPAAAVQLGHVVGGAAETAREVVTRSYPRGPADLSEHVAVLDRLVALRHSQQLGTGALDHVAGLVRKRLADNHGREGLTAILD